VVTLASRVPPSRVPPIQPIPVCTSTGPLTLKASLVEHGNTAWTRVRLARMTRIGSDPLKILRFAIDLLNIPVTK
jgi:hypothetical protein